MAAVGRRHHVVDARRMEALGHEHCRPRLEQAGPGLATAGAARRRRFGRVGRASRRTARVVRAALVGRAGVIGCRRSSTPNPDATVTYSQVTYSTRLSSTAPLPGQAPLPAPDAAALLRRNSADPDLGPRPAIRFGTRCGATPVPGRGPAMGEPPRGPRPPGRAPDPSGCCSTTRPTTCSPWAGRRWPAPPSSASTPPGWASTCWPTSSTPTSTWWSPNRPTSTIWPASTWATARSWSRTDGRVRPTPAGGTPTSTTRSGRWASTIPRCPSMPTPGGRSSSPRGPRARPRR